MLFNVRKVRNIGKYKMLVCFFCLESECNAFKANCLSADSKAMFCGQLLRVVFRALA